MLPCNTLTEIHIENPGARLSLNRTKDFECMIVNQATINILELSDELQKNASKKY